MARFDSEAAAEAAGLHIVHEPERHRFVVYDRTGDEPQLRGEARYSLLGDTGIDFDGTVVDPALRGTGVAGLLVRHALSSSIVEGREIIASCWYVAGFLQRHPEYSGSSQ